MHKYKGKQLATSNFWAEKSTDGKCRFAAGKLKDVELEQPITLLASCGLSNPGQWAV